MTTQIIDRAVAPTYDQAMQAVSEVEKSTGQRTGWNVYTGGAGSAASGWTPELVDQLKGASVPLMAISVPEQDFTDYQRAANDVYTAVEGLADFDLLQMPRLFLDMEAGATAGDLAENARKYVAWADGLDSSNQKGIYGSPGFLITISADPAIGSEFWPPSVWVASTFWNDPRAENPYDIPDFPEGLWYLPGQRGWQYATATVAGMTVDLSVFDDLLVLVS